MKSEFEEKDWNNEGKKITINMNNFQNLLKELTKKLDYIKNENIKDNDIDENKIESEIENAKKNIEPLISKIREKISTYACNFQLAANQENKKNEKEEKENELMMDLMNNDDFLQKRREELESAHKISAQIKDMSQNMVDNVNQQGEMLKHVEDNVIEAEENAKKAKEEIKKADKMSRGNIKCVIFYIILIVGSLAALGLLSWGIYKIIKNKNNNENISYLIKKVYLIYLLLFINQRKMISFSFIVIIITIGITVRI